jgi:hypothetical protein
MSFLFTALQLPFETTRLLCCTCQGAPGGSTSFKSPVLWRARLRVMVCVADQQRSVERGCASSIFCLP